MDEVVSYISQPRDRRRRKRYFRRKNILIATGLILAVFLVLSYASEFRTPGSGEHGRLYRKRARGIETVPNRSPVPVVVEAPVSGEGRVDPWSVDSARREQYLGVPTTTAITNETLLVPPATGSDVLIPTDVPQTAPLRGGFMRDGAAPAASTAADPAPTIAVPAEPAVNIPAQQPVKVEGKVVITHGADGVIVLKKE